MAALGVEVVVTAGARPAGGEGHQAPSVDRQVPRGGVRPASRGVRPAGAGASTGARRAKAKALVVAEARPEAPARAAVPARNAAQQNAAAVRARANEAAVAAGAAAAVKAAAYTEQVPTSMIEVWTCVGVERDVALGGLHAAPLIGWSMIAQSCV